MARRRKRAEAKGLAAPLWMITYGDMMTLLLCFFILLFSFSTLDLIKFRDVIIEVQGALGVLSGGPMVLNLGDIPARQITENLTASQNRMQQIQEAVEEKVEEEGYEGAIQTALDERGLMVRFTDTALFDLGKADIKPQVLPILQAIAEELIDIANLVRVEGHTDPTPIHTAEFPSNWELSTARATAIVHYLIEEGGVPPERLSAAGFAYYHPVVPNTTPENRARNRRVDVIILRTEEERVRNPGGELQAGDGGEVDEIDAAEAEEPEESSAPEGDESAPESGEEPSDEGADYTDNEAQEEPESDETSG